MKNQLGRLKGRLLVCAMLLACLVVLPGLGFAADVDVYAEGAYTSTDLVIYLYADINNPDPILSFGVSVNYPAGLTFDPDPEESSYNESKWFFGDGVTNHAYMLPENTGNSSTGGQVVMVGGKLDTRAGHALDGVTGTRVLLGKVRFTHGGMTDFGAVTIDFGRDGAYANFVATDAPGTVLDTEVDGVGFSLPEIHERGDANHDNVITFADMSAVRALITDNKYVVYGDCNDDGVITFADMSCVRSKI